MSFTFLLIHSDDIIIISHNASIMNAAKSELLNAFEGTDNGNLTSFCGVEIKVTSNQISLSMEYYWKKLMDKFNVPENEVEDSRTLKNKDTSLGMPHSSRSNNQKQLPINYRLNHLWLHTLQARFSLSCQHHDKSYALTC